MRHTPLCSYPDFVPDSRCRHRGNRRQGCGPYLHAEPFSYFVIAHSNTHTYR
jgi:hypothetical protein